MSKLFHYALLASALGAAGVVATPATTVMAKSAGGGVQCELRVSPLDGAMLLTGVAHASRATSGRYSLTIAKDGDTSGADMQQEGSFSVAAGGASTLSEVNMSLEPDANYTAVLTLVTGGGRISCRQAVTTRI
jgi:hypothetical protein